METVRLKPNFHPFYYMGRDESWWVERVAWYNKLGHGPVNEGDIDTFFHTSFMQGGWTTLMVQMQTVYAFWEAHPQLEELVCK